MREMLSPEAQWFFDRQDVDATFFDWNIPAEHARAFDELVQKGYLIKINDNPAKYRFADDVIADKDKEMLR